MTDLELAQAAQAAYSAAPTWSSGDIHACLSEHPDGPVVAFRGTVPSSMADWLRDIDAWPTYDPLLGWCHTGFLEGAKAVFQGVQEAARARPLRLVGHSLGGALAALEAALLVANGWPVRELVTFGAPRVALSKPQALLFRTPVRQYRHGADPVPEVPPIYRHIRTPLILIGTPGADPLADHFIANYIAALAAEGYSHA